MRKLFVAPLAALVALGLGACERGPTAVDDAQSEVSPSGIDAPLSAAAASSAAMKNSGAPFETWRQGFNHGTEGWVTDDTPGVRGWCGDIEQVRRGQGAVSPSAGRAHAVVEWGECNAFYRENTSFQYGAPYSPGAGFSSTWPASGFVYELDVYLDPELDGGTEFTLSGNVCIRDAESGECVFAPTSFRYFAVSVRESGDGLSVRGHEIQEPGWYTFRFVLGSEQGKLAVDFQLRQDDRTLFTEPMRYTLFTGEQISSFDVAGLGSGYLWFVSVPEGLRLPIDEHMVRRGE